MNLNIDSNVLGIDEGEIFSFATRNNEKRRFLFVSKLLGKHLSVKPTIAILSGKLLALLYAKVSCNCNFEVKNDIDDKITTYKETIKKIVSDARNVDELEIKSLVDYKVKIDKKTLVIAFAETATSLGHLVFDTFDTSGTYYHTTRENIEYDGNVIEFLEEHSHATNHKVYENNELKISSSSKIVLVDDEISTGKTLLNIIESLISKYSIKEFSVLTIMDLRSIENVKRFENFEKKHSINIDVISLIKGNINSVQNLDLTLDNIKKHSIFSKTASNSYKTNTRPNMHEIYDFSVNKEKKEYYIDSTGRFGIDLDTNSKLKIKIKETAIDIQKYVIGKTLVLGTEEFMYIPLMIASELNGNINFKSTTRSPIYPSDADNYPIKSGIRFKSIYNSDVNNYIYNLENENFDTILVFLEKTKSNILLEELNSKLRRLSTNVEFFILSNEKKG